MRNLFILLILMCIGVGFAYADGAGKLPSTVDSIKIQAFRGLPSTVRSDTIAGTKAFKNISTAGYRGIRVFCTDHAGKDVACRFSYNGAAKMLPITSGTKEIYLDSTVYASGGYMTFGNISSNTTSTVYLDSERM